MLEVAIFSLSLSLFPSLSLSFTLSLSLSLFLSLVHSFTLSLSLPLSLFHDRLEIVTIAFRKRFPPTRITVYHEDMAVFKFKVYLNLRTKVGGDAAVGKKNVADFLF